MSGFELRLKMLRRDQNGRLNPYCSASAPASREVTLGRNPGSTLHFPDAVLRRTGEKIDASEEGLSRSHGRFEVNESGELVYHHTGTNAVEVTPHGGSKKSRLEKGQSINLGALTDGVRHDFEFGERMPLLFEEMRDGKPPKGRKFLVRIAVDKPKNGVIKPLGWPFDRF